MPYSLSVHRFIWMMTCAFFGGVSAQEAPAADSPVILRLWSIPDMSSPSVDAMAARRVMDQFLRQHPEVVLQKTTGISIPQIGGSAAILMAIAGGVAPDILECSQDDVSKFVEQGFLLPLDNYLKDIPIEARRERAPDQVWNAARQIGPDGKPHIYALPQGYAVSSLKVRRDLAARHGYPEAKLPVTWSDLYAMFQAVSDPDTGRYGVGLPRGPELAGVFHTLLVAAGGRAMEATQDGKLKAVFDSEEGVMALDFLWKLLRGPWERNGKRYKGVAYTDVSLWNAHKRGKFIIGFTSMSDKGLLRAADKDRFLLVPMPKAPNGKSVPCFTSEFVGLFAGQKSGRICKAAFDYIWFLESQPARKVRTEVLVSEGGANSANPVYLRQFGFTHELQEFPAGYLEFYERALKEGAMRACGPGASQIVWALNNPVQRVLVEKLDHLNDATRRQRISVILKESARDINQRLSDEMSLADRGFRKGIAFLAAAAIFGAFVYLFRTVHRAYAGGIQRQDEPGLKQQCPEESRWVDLKAAVALLPALVLVALWEYYPLLRGMVIAFQDYRILEGTRFVGLDNFVEALFSRFFWSAMGRTVVYVALSLGLGFFTPIFLAILLHEIPRGKVFFRVLYYLPALTSGIVVIFLWKTFYESGPSGYFNQILALFKMTPQRWLEDPKLAMLCCVLPTVWAGVGPGSLIYLAALKSVPEELFEAAAMDGCGFWGKVRHVALPYMKPLVIMNFVGAFIGAFQSSGYILILTAGGPDSATTVASLEIFYEAYARLRFGAATAMSWILAFSLIGFTLFQIKYLSKIEFRSASAR